MNNFLIYKTFRNLDDASELIDLLEKNKITFSLIDNTHDVDITFTGNKHQSDIQVLLKRSDFELVNELLEEAANSQINFDDTSYYLFEFSDEELYEIIEKRDEWSSYDYAFAKKLLEKRGQKINEVELQELKAKREQELAKPEEGPKIQIFAGYFFALFGGLIGLLIGWFLWRAKKTTPNGTKVFTYTESQRNHGKAITILSFVAIIGWLLIQFVFN